MDISKFRTDATLEVDGVEIPVGDGLTLRIARAGNDKASAEYRRLTSDPRVQMAIRTNTMDPAEMRRIVDEVYASTILLGWSGLTEDGKEIPYSREKAKELLGIRDFRAMVQSLAETQELFRKQAVTSTVDELGKLSAGNSSTEKT